MLSELWHSTCVEMKEVPAITCTCLTLPVGCTLYRSKEKLPEFVEDSYGFINKSVTSVDGSEDLQGITPYNYQTKRKLKWNKTKYFFIEDRYLYTPNATYPVIKVVGWFKKKPKESCDTLIKTNCSMLEQTFPCPEYLLSYIIQASLQELGMFKQITYDHIEDKNTTK
jgi:hypothetical protein